MHKHSKISFAFPAFNSSLKINTQQKSMLILLLQFLKLANLNIAQLIIFVRRIILVVVNLVYLLVQ